MNLASPVGRSNRTNTTYLKYKHNYYILVFVHRFLGKIKHRKIYQKIIIMHIINIEQLFVVYLIHTSRLTRVSRMYTELKSLQPAVYNCCSSLSYRYLIAPAFPVTTVRSAGSVRDGRYRCPCLPRVELNDSGPLKINQIYLFYS